MEVGQLLSRGLWGQLNARPGNNRASRAGVAAQGRPRKAQSRSAAAWPSISLSKNSPKTASVLSPVRANQEVYKLLKDGIRVTYRTSDDNEAIETVKIIDWEHPANNDFFLASQFWISGEYGRKRADLIGFVNGIPLLFIELKASHKHLENAYKLNLSDYRTTIPQVFWYNGLIILSNGSKSRIGSITAGWEHFSEWKKINDEGEEGRVSLETMIRGVCDPARLLDLVENFTLFEAKGETNKLLAKNHQFLGVNKAISAAQHIKANQGKLGVFWHTQGSGKSYSMVFFSQKVLRKVPGNWTFLIVTDREDLGRPDLSQLCIDGCSHRGGTKGSGAKCGTSETASQC